MKKGNLRKNETLLKNKVIPATLTALAVSILTLILYYLNFDLSYGSGSSAILFASFGTSAFVLFMMPKSKAAKIGSFVKAYIFGALLGLSGFYMLYALPLYVVAGIVIFFFSLVMYIGGAEHPPAIGIAMAFVLFRIDIYGVLVVAAGVVILLFLRMVLEKFMYIVEKDIIKDIEHK
ncbi:MAG: HPP family protein [Candidatus Micrarchaeota archaeon]|nr:HPP family protein [Candidatus Micrarchaeota archaeon]